MLNIYINIKMNIKNIPLKNRTFFYKDEELIYGEDLYIEFKNYKFPFSNQNVEEIKKQICGFLNSKGGRIYIGIDDKKIIKGIQLEYKKFDEIRNNIINYTFDFFPKCRINKIRVYFIPIKNENNLYIKNLYVIKIIINQGDTNQLYSIIEKGGFISFMRLSGQCANLTAQEIRDEIIQRNKFPGELINENEFQDPQPENPELIINNNINQLNSMINNINLSNQNYNNYNNRVKNNYKKNKRNFNKNIYNISDYNDEEEENEEEDDDEDNEFDDEEEEEEEEEHENNYSNNRGLKKFRGRGRIKNNKNKRIRNKYYVVKITTFGPNPSISVLKLLFNKLPNCKKKFLNKNGKIHGFLNFNNYDDAVKIVKEYTEHTPSFNGCGVKLSLQSVPSNY